MTTPKISVLTPLYNTNECDLRAMVESILNQTFKDFEFLLLKNTGRVGFPTLPSLSTINLWDKAQDHIYNDRWQGYPNW